MRTVPLVERRARLAHRQLLAVPARGPVEVAEALVAVHSSDPTSVYLAMWARIPGFAVTDLEKTLYEDRTLIRHWAMRRTLWVVTRSMLPDFVSSSTDPIGSRERRRTIQMIEDGGVAADGEAWLSAVLPKTMTAIRGAGEVFTRNLSRSVPGLEDKIVFTDKRGQVVGTTGMASRALTQLGMESEVVRARPAGTWVSGQYSWAAMDDWLGAPLPRHDSREAGARVIDRYLRAFGPVTDTDVRWWTGWTAARTRAALADVGAVEVEIEGSGPGFLHPDDVESVDPPAPWVSILPSLDSTTMGWKEREWYLGDNGAALFDRNGNAGPTIWVDGRVVGGWAQRRDGEVVHEVFEDIGAEATNLVADRIAELGEWLGDVTITPRFRSPHDRALAP